MEKITTNLSARALKQTLVKFIFHSVIFIISKHNYCTILLL